MNVHLISLGCDKNLVESEYMLGNLRDAGHDIVNDAEDAEVIIVNTCGFIEEATRESIQTIIEVSRHKKARCRRLIVTGCMAERYGEDIAKNLPEVDLVTGFGLKNIVALVNGASSVEEQRDDNSEKPHTGRRVLSTHGGFAYLKISDGCDNHCAYCTIPSIKGRYRSAPPELLLNEARELAAEGVRELILVAQDTTRYGQDLAEPSRDYDLAQLMNCLSKIEGIEWIRLLYAYPENITQRLIDEMANNPKILQYIDMPIQHASDAILRKMGRKSNQAGLRSVICRLRAAMPDIAIRTTLIVGFPTETNMDFNILKTFVSDARFDRLGVFAYSREDGTAAANMPNQVRARVKKLRRDEILKLQQRISLEKNKALIGQTLDVIIEGRLPDEPNVYCGRSYRDSHDIDGLVFFDSDEELISGEFVKIMISKAEAYDLYGERVLRF
ncbi:MAG: 30S ribosomal protein S12 methylthiotransferase RimO [Clostridiales bacterium]|jgi:ribosomal protein S12 methylthiotransferase|nr:30S ribosomal protein S12 methylthiotransferase RimO [Clostridiales bacterium]